MCNRQMFVLFPILIFSLVLILGVGLSCGSALPISEQIATEGIVGDGGGQESASERKPVLRIPYAQTWYGGAVFYQIFVRSFADSNGDGIGDLQGIISKLDYLNSGKDDDNSDLKIAGLWLTPIFKSGSYHGYDVQDFQSIDPVYGSMADFEQLLTEAHRRGIKVILDLVLNHSSNRHPWFVDSASGPSASKRDWYVWSASDPGWKHPFSTNRSPWVLLNNAYYYAIFSPAMPDLNLNNAEVKAEIKRVIDFWLDKGVDGFRLDAVRYLVADSEDTQADSVHTHAFLKDIVAHAHKRNAQALFVGEAWTTSSAVAQYFGDGDELDLCFHFDLVDAIDRAFARERASAVAMALGLIISLYPDIGFNAPILGNHDHKRLMSRIGHSFSAAKLAATLLLSLPGTPFIYYGEEIGMGNSQAEGDIAKRTPMQWDATSKAGFSTGIPWTALYGKQEQISVAAQGDQQDSLLQHYRRIIRLRNNTPVLKHGSLLIPEHSDSESGAGFSLLRQYEGQTLLAIFNFSETKAIDVSVKLDKALRLPSAQTLKDLISNTPISLKLDASEQTIGISSIPPHGFILLQWPTDE